ncbi:hypothetical protein [Luteimonas huabeiensis]|nr:hypothetical protein [Luteimonas huabeiensis]
MELQAEVLEALRQVEISSCGGRACIRVDARAPTWRNGDGEYVLVDGR